MALDHEDIAKARDLFGNDVEGMFGVGGEGGVAGLEEDFHAGADRDAGADGLHFALGALCALGFDGGVPAFGGGMGDVEQAHDFNIDRIGGAGIGAVAEADADLGDDVDGEIAVGLAFFSSGGFEHPEDDEKAHHEHDEIGEREDPLGTFFAFSGFAFAFGFGHFDSQDGSPQRRRERREELIFVSHYDTLYAVDQHRDIEIDYEADFAAREFEVCEYLGSVNWGERVNGLDLYYDLAADE